MLGPTRHLRFLMAISFILCRSGPVAAQDISRHVKVVPALKITAPSGAVSLLLGSFHGRDGRVAQPSPHILDGAKRFIIEHYFDESDTRGNGGIALMDPGSFLRLLQTGKITPASWLSQLTMDQVSELRRRLKCHLPPETKNEEISNLLAMRPQIVAYIGGYPCSNGQPKSRDELLLGYARDSAIPITELESSIEVQRQRDAVPDDLWVKGLVVALANDTALITKIIAAINAGDYDAVAQTAGLYQPDRADAQLFQAKMVSERNAAWMPRLEGFLA